MGFVVGAKYTMTMKQRDQGQEERQKVRRSFLSDNDVRRPDRRAAQCDGRTEGDTPPGLFRNGRGSGGPDGSRYRGQREGAGLSREACVLCAPPTPPAPRAPDSAACAQLQNKQVVPSRRRGLASTAQKNS